MSRKDHILRDNGPLVYRGHAGQDVSAGHFGDDQFGAAFCRIHASVLQRIAKPCWRMVFQDDRSIRRTYLAIRPGQAQSDELVLAPKCTPGYRGGRLISVAKPACRSQPASARPGLPCSSVWFLT